LNKPEFLPVIKLISFGPAVGFYGLAFFNSDIPRFDARGVIFLYTAQPSC